MSHFRYKHTVSITFFGGGLLGSDPAAIVDGIKEDAEILPERTCSKRYMCWLKGETTLVISSIHFDGAAPGDEPFLLRCGGETDDRPHDIVVECFIPSIILPTPLPLPPRMALYLSIPLGLTVMLVGTATSDVPPPTKDRLDIPPPAKGGLPS